MVIGNDYAVKIKALTLFGNGVKGGQTRHDGQRPAGMNRDA